MAGEHLPISLHSSKGIKSQETLVLVLLFPLICTPDGEGVMSSLGLGLSSMILSL